MDFVDNIDLVFPAEGEILHLFAQLPDIFHPGIRSAVNLDHIDRPTLRNLSARITLIAGTPLLPGRVRAGAAQCFRKDAGQRRLSDPANARKEISMRHLLQADGIHQRRGDVALADHVFEGLGPPFPGGYLIIHNSSVWKSLRCIRWRDQAILRHTGELIYRCFLPDLAGFISSYCTGPGLSTKYTLTNAYSKVMGNSGGERGI